MNKNISFYIWVREDEKREDSIEEIWFISNIDKYYIISERREKVHWIQNILHNPRVMFSVNYKSFEGKVRIVDKTTESKLAEEVSSLFHTKYGWSDGLIVELTPYKEQDDSWMNTKMQM